jgi:hypothetical protein
MEWIVPHGRHRPSPDTSTNGDRRPWRSNACRDQRPVNASCQRRPVESHQWPAWTSHFARTTFVHMRTFIVVLAMAVGPLAAMAQGSSFGLGIMVGEPTGISWKYWSGGDRALAGGVAWGLSNNGYFHLHADYLFHKMDLIPVSTGKLPLYFGPGVRMRTTTATSTWASVFPWVLHTCSMVHRWMYSWRPPPP